MLTNASWTRASGRFSGQVVLITGGARGIGYHLAAEFARGRATVVLADIDEVSLRAAVAHLTAAGARAFGYRHDVADRAACYALHEAVAREVGPVDVLVNNAGIVRKGDFLGASDQDWADTVDVNLSGLLWMTRAFLPGMVERGLGHVVNVASILGSAAVGGAAVYCATKHAVMGFSEALRFELVERGHRGVHVTTVCPGFTDTGMFAGVKVPFFLQLVPPERMARAIYRGVAARATVVRSPLLFRFLPQIRALIPTFLWDRLTRWAGAHRAMDSHQGEARPPRPLGAAAARPALPDPAGDAARGSRQAS